MYTCINIADPTSSTELSLRGDHLPGVKAECRPSVGTDSIMSLVTIAILLATVSISLTRSQETEISAKGLEVAPAPVKLDKNLRRALLKALADLEAESAEQHKEDEFISQKDADLAFETVSKKNLNKNLGVAQKPTFSFKGFPGDEEAPSEDKLQNSSFVQTTRYVTLKTPSMNIEKATKEDARSFHVQNVILPTRNPASFPAKTDTKREQTADNKNTKAPAFTVSKVESITLKPTMQISETLAGSATSGIAVANALAAPKPTASSPTATATNATSTKVTVEKSEEVKIFQAPLVAAFTVQQDELGVPKSVVPIYRSAGDGQALTLQEQLDFKQKLLEKQLADLQQQQIQQTQFLVRQRQLYEQQLRQKQQHHYYLQEQARINQFEEQARLKRLEEHRQKQLEEQRLKQLEEQRLYRFQQPHNLPSKQHFFEQSNNVLPFQPPIESNVRLQPSLALELPNAAGPPPFHPNFQDQLRLQQIRQHQQPQQQPQQQRVQQSFASFPTEFQPPLPSTTRFNRQEAFNSVGNFGFNLDNKPTASRNTFGFNAPQRSPQNFYNPYTQFRQTRPPTPAKQIQHLLYQSGIAGDLGNVQGSNNHEDLNIVSKVLALNVGAIPNKNLQYTTNNRLAGKA